MDATNLVVLQGTLSSDPVVRELESGSILVTLEVTTRDVDDIARTVPVSVFDPPNRDEVTGFVKGDGVVVVGAVTRRYFRGASGTASRTEVVADRVVPSGRRSRVRTLMATAARTLGS